MTGPAAGSLPELPVVFRPVRTRLVLIGAGGVLFVVLTVVAVALASLGPGERVGLVVTGLLALGVLLLLSRPKVVADTRGVTVTNLTHTRRMDWEELLAVHLRAGDPWVHLDLADGTSLPAMGIQPGIAREQAVRDARTLRELAAAYGSATPGT